MKFQEMIGHVGGEWIDDSRQCFTKDCPSTKCKVSCGGYISGRYYVTVECVLGHKRSFKQEVESFRNEMLKLKRWR